MLSMYILNKITGQPGFQANPSRIDSDKNEVVFAHCTLPIDMADSYDVMTHFESGIGVALRGQMKETDITAIKFVAEKDGKKALCMCKQSKNKPFSKLLLIFRFLTQLFSFILASFLHL